MRGGRGVGETLYFISSLFLGRLRVTEKRMFTSVRIIVCVGNMHDNSSDANRYDSEVATIGVQIINSRHLQHKP